MALVTRRAGGEGDSGVNGAVVGAGDGEDAAGKVNLADRSLELRAIAATQTNKMRISAKLVSAAAAATAATALFPVSTH